MKKVNILMFVGVVMLGLFGFGASGYAHGYITSPGSRAYFGTAAAASVVLFVFMAVFSGVYLKMVSEKE